MKLSNTISLSVIAMLIGSGIALAQTPSPSPAPSASPAPAAGADAEKKAVSKACSDQANAKGLHGKERKTFRSDCKKNGGKAS